MFSNQEENSIIPVLLAVLLVIAAVVSAGVFLLSLFSTPSNSSTVEKQNNQEASEDNQIAERQKSNPQNQEIKQEYLSQLDTLEKNLKQKDYSRDEKIEKVTKFLFEARVPKQFLDSHLQAAIKFRKIRNTLGNKGESVSRLSELIGGISKQK